MAGIETLYLFPVYQTREAYKAATGGEAPAWNSAKPIKSWFDPNPPSPDEDGNVQYLMIALGKDKRTPAVGLDGKPYLRLTRISAVEAATVNIPPKDFSPDTRIVDPGALSPTASIELPVPCRPLNPDEEFAFGFGATVQVRKKESAPPPQGDTSSPVDLAPITRLLESIESKLDVLLATSRTTSGA